MHECIICNENIINNNKIALTCCHLFHTNCIITMIQKRYRKCPICRTRITWTIPQLLRHNHLYINKNKGIEFSNRLGKMIPESNQVFIISSFRTYSQK